jgi:hypothetical protein
MLSKSVVIQGTEVDEDDESHGTPEEQRLEKYAKLSGYKKTFDDKEFDQHIAY